MGSDVQSDRAFETFIYADEQIEILNAIGAEEDGNCEPWLRTMIEQTWAGAYVAGLAAARAESAALRAEVEGILVQWEHVGNDMGTTRDLYLGGKADGIRAITRKVRSALAARTPAPVEATDDRL